MRVAMTALEFRRFLDGFGLTLFLLGVFANAALLLGALLTIFGVRSISMPSLAFQALVLMALGGCLRLLVRIDKRLEGPSE